MLSWKFLDSQPEGCVLIGGWGVPPLAHEDDAARATLAATEMVEAMDAIGISVAIGVSTGAFSYSVLPKVFGKAADDPLFPLYSLACSSVLPKLNLEFSLLLTQIPGKAFCGAVGSKERREYALVGTIVNLSARLMATAWKRQLPVLVEQVCLFFLKEKTQRAS